MERLLQSAKLALLLSVVVLVGFVCWGIKQEVVNSNKVTQDVHTTTTKINGAVDKISSVATNLNNVVTDLQPKLDATATSLQISSDNLEKATEGINITIAELNKPCLSNDAEDCGTVAYLNKTLKTTRLAVGQITAVSLKEQGQLQKINEQESTVAEDTHKNLVKLGDSLDGFNKFLTVQLPPLMSNVTIAAANVDSVTADAKTEMHKIVHPSWPAKVVKGIVTVPGQVLVWLLTKI